MRVLAIDDEEDCAGSCCRVVLETAGAEVIDNRVGARQGWSASRVVVPTSLVVDLGMPEMDGFEFISARAFGVG